MEDIPNEIYWEGRGIAKKCYPRGMSDYCRIGNNADYKTSCGALLKRRFFYNGNSVVLTFVAQYKGFTTKSYPTALEAIQALNKLETS